MKFAFLLVLSVVTASAATKTIYIDPSSRWESLHDRDGAGAPAEMTKELMRACPAKLSVTSDSQAADFTLTFTRKGGSGTAVIYAGKEAVHAFKPGFSATLKATAVKVCAAI